jgi:hypothetical protein
VELSPEGLRGFFETTGPHLNERQRRVVAGALAEAFGRGGQSFVVEASGMSTNTMWKAVREVRQGISDPRLVAAIVDRLTFNAHIIETGTESFRLRSTKAKRATTKRS